MKKLTHKVWNRKYPRKVRVLLLYVFAMLTIGVTMAQDDVACQTSDIEQSVFNSFADYHTTLGADSVSEAVQDVETLIESLRQIVSICSDDIEDAVESDDIDVDSSQAEAEGAGEGTYADPVKVNWIRGDGEGRWVGVIGYYRWGRELCGSYCKEVNRGNEFIAVYVYGKCDESRRTRCAFKPYSGFELAGQRRVPYEPEFLGSSYDALPLFSEEILPGGESEGLVFFQVPEDERDFIFGWTPNYSAETIWFVAQELME